MKPKLLTVVVLLAVALVFVAQNSKLVSVKFLFVSTEPLPMSVLFLAMLVLGFICGLMFGLLGKARPKR